MTPVDPGLVREIVGGYTLSPMGVHGLPHWGRVLEIGLRLADETKASRSVVALFAVFHDSRRENDAIDPEHGRRGAELAATLRDAHFEITDAEFDLLRYACEEHTCGLTEADVTVQTCWDADRLDLPRVGIRPRNDLLCTAAARDPEIQRWAADRSIAGHAPSFVTNEWG